MSETAPMTKKNPASHCESYPTQCGQNPDVRVETINVLVASEEGNHVTQMTIDAPPSSAKGICALPTMNEKRVLKENWA